MPWSSRCPTPTWGRWQRAAGYLAYLARARPQFLAYSVADLPALPPLFTRYIFRRPVLTWTVRTDADRATAAKWADQVIFEGWRPYIRA